MINSDDIEKFTINVGSELSLCLVKLELNNLKTLLVTNNKKVVGTITDGDIRKALLNNRKLSIPVDQVMNSDYFFGSSESECKIIFKKHSYIFVVPHLNHNRELIKIYLRKV